MVLPRERNREWLGRPYALSPRESRKKRGKERQGDSRIMEPAQFAKQIDGNSLC